MKIFGQLLNRGNAERDQHLKTAFACVPGRSFHLRVDQFRRAITRFETAWRKTGGAPPRRMTPFAEALYRAREANGGPLPNDEYTLAKILYDGDAVK